MMNVPFLYINIIALCCYVFIFITFLVSKKTREIRSFLLLMAGCIVWTAGSVLMRLQVFPGINFWFHVSIFGLFSMALLIYLFVATFAQLKGFFLKTVLIVTTVIIEALELPGILLKAPVMETLADGSVVFTYNIDGAIIITGVYFLFYVIAMIAVFIGIIRTKGSRSSGILYVVVSCVIMLAGNMLQLLPGNVFPYDTLSGCVFALLLIWAMYKKRMFQMSLLISRSVVLVAGMALCIAAATYFVSPLVEFFVSHYYMDAAAASTIIVVALSLLLSVMYVFIKRLIDALFTREEQQGKLLKSFSNAVSQSLNTGDITRKVIKTIRAEIPVKSVYICLKSGKHFVAATSSEELADMSFSISEDSPCIKYLSGETGYLIISEFRKNPLYLSVWQDEKELFGRLGVSCIFALRDATSTVGLILLSDKEKGGQLTYTELSFLETICSISSIAVKNAGLYEQMYREARFDSLTGVYNYRYFVERAESEFDACRNDSLALLYVDLDDFKLYNQLYGALEGDKILRAVADIMGLCVGTSGTVFRYSGKVFAALLPRCDGRGAELLAREIKRRVETLNTAPGRQENLRPISISCGICVSPYAASSAKELIENADLAVYTAKESGKDRIIIFKGASPVSQRVSERALSIVENTANLNSAYKANTATISALTAAIDAKDHYTYKHSLNVAMYSAILATAAGLNTDQIAMIYESALLHDIGKISIPESILSKSGSLTGDEYTVMKSHVNNSIDMIRHLPSMDYVIPAAVGHHERWDGKGYPRGISGQDIPIAARCLAIADSFDAMTTDRPYRKGLTKEYAAEQIEQNAGTQFDPELSAIFVRLIRTGELAAVLGR